MTDQEVLNHNLEVLRNYIFFCFILTVIMVSVSTVWIVTKVNRIETTLIEQSKFK